MYNNITRSYRKVNIITTDPKGLVLMCYEGGIENLKIAREKIIEKDYEGKSRAIVKAQDIINELLCSLDFKKGGAISTNLSSLYNYMLKRIIFADLNNDTDVIDEVVLMLQELLSAWREVFGRQQKEITPGLDNYSGMEMRQTVSGYGV